MITENLGTLLCLISYYTRRTKKQIGNGNYSIFCIETLRIILSIFKTSSYHCLYYVQHKIIPWYEISINYFVTIFTFYFNIQLVELKNGETYNGHLVSCDNWMNINLREVICTSKVNFPLFLNIYLCYCYSEYQP
jgi:hypothetical protein